MLKKFLLSTILFASVILIFQVPVFAEEIKTTNANGIKISNEEYEKLLDLGFSDLTIEHLDENEFNELIDLEPESSSRDTGYYEIKENKEDVNLQSINGNIKPQITKLSKEEYFKRVEAQKNQIKTFNSEDTTSTSYRRLITQIDKFPGGIRLHSRFVWDIMPSTRSYDVLSTSIDDLFTPLPDSESGKQVWLTVHPVYGTTNSGSATYDSSSSLWNRQSSGYGVKMNLKNDQSNARVTELEGYIYYWIARISNIEPNFINAYGNYSHQARSTDVNFSFSLTYGAPSIGFSGVSKSNFDAITTHAQDNYY